MELTDALLTDIDRAVSRILDRYRTHIHDTRMRCLNAFRSTIFSRRQERLQQAKNVIKIPDRFDVILASANGNKRPNNAAGITAITFSDRDNAQARTIYFREPHPGLGTIAHELFHWLCHGNFWVNFHKIGPGVGKLDEGLTEFFTRKVLPPDVSRRGHYDEEHEEVVSSLRSKTFSEEDLCKAYFQGADVDIRKITKSVSSARRRGGDLTGRLTEYAATLNRR